MKKIIFFGVIVFVLIVGVLVAGIYRFNPKDEVVLNSDPLNTTYTIAGKEYTLINGKIEKEIVAGSASKEIISIFGEPVYADLDKDTDLDAVMFLTQQTGGNGTFFYVVVAVNENGEYKGTDAMFLGDRIAPQNINIKDGRAVANFAVRRADESFSTQPNIGKSVWVNLDAKNLKIGEWVKDFEGEADSSKMTLGMKTWQWISVSYNNVLMNANNDKFKITFKEDGNFFASTDCNGIGGEYIVNGNQIKFDKMISTLMYCEGSQENDFSKILSEASSFSFTSKGELILDLKVDSGRAVFR